MPILTFDANGGSFGTDHTDFIAQGGSFIGNTPIISSTDAFSPYLGHISTLSIRTGYTCSGWTTNADGSGIFYGRDGERPNITSDITFYAKWIRVYTVTYDSNGGSGTFIYGVQNFVEGELVSVVPPTVTYGFSRLGYNQTHWNTSADNSGVSYGYDGQFIITNDVTLYAIWLEVGYITYDGNGVTSGRQTLNLNAQGVNSAYLIDNVITSDGIAWGSVSYILDGQLTAGIPFVKDGYIVVSWNTNADGTGDSYEIFNAYYVKINFHSHITLYAQWKLKATVHYDYVRIHPLSNRDTISYVSGVVTVRKSTDAFQLTNGSDGDEIYDWNTSSDGSGITYHSGDLITLSGDITLYALWKPVTYISFNLNGALGINNPPRQKLRTDIHCDGVNYIQFPTLVTPTTYDKAFKYWSDNPEGTGVEHIPGVTYSIDSNLPVIFYAIWESLEFITFDANYPSQGVNGGLTTDKITLDFTEGSYEVVLPDYRLTNSFYRHSGWIDDDYLIYPLSSKVILVRKGLNLKAVWEYMPLLTVDGNGSTTGVIPVPTRHPKSFFTGNFSPFADISLISFQKTGYVLPIETARVSPWIRSKVASNIDPNEFDYTVVANWVKAYVFKYDGNGADEGTPPDGLEIDFKLHIKVPDIGTLKKDGCRFINWNTSSDGSGVTYIPWVDTVNDPKSFFDFNPDEVDGLPYAPRNVTLYAQWVALCSLRYNLNGGIGLLPATELFDQGITYTTIVKQLAVVKDNYIFTGWNTSIDGSGVGYLSGDLITLFNSSIVLYAQWRELITVTYNPNTSGVQNIITTPINSGESITIAGNTFVRVNYTFISWNTESNGSGTTFNYGDIVILSSRLVLYAQWSYIPEVRFLLNYSLNNVEDSGTVFRYPIGTNILIPKEPTRQGYKFIRWITNNSEYVNHLYPGDTLVIQTSDLVLRAEWVRNYYITYSLDGSTDNEVFKEVISTNQISIYNATGITKNGLIFSHWTTNADGTGLEFQSNDLILSPSTDVILYAQWKTGNIYASNSIYTIYTK